MRIDRRAVFILFPLCRRSCTMHKRMWSFAWALAAVGLFSLSQASFARDTEDSNRSDRSNRTSSTSSDQSSNQEKTDRTSSNQSGTEQSERDDDSQAHHAALGVTLEDS